MKEVVPGHVYELDNLHSEHKTHLSFYQDPRLHEGHKINGPSTQEVIRACIARVKYLETEQPAEENPAILRALRKAIMLFELRAKRRQLEKVRAIDELPVDERGHVVL